MAVGMSCARSRSRGTLHMEGQAAAVVAIGTGSVGMIVVEALARTGIQNLSLFEFYTVEDVNLDRLLRATARDARLHRAKVDLAARTVHRAATAMNIRVTPHETSVTEPDGFAATDCDVIFSYVDRSWPRAALNLLANAHLILVVDGGIAVDARGGRLNGAWRAHVAMERDGLLDNPAYIKGSAPDHPLRRKENVFIVSASAAATQPNQFLTMITAPGGIPDSGLPPRHLGTWSVSEGRWLHRNPIADAEPGALILPRGRPPHRRHPVGHRAGRKHRPHHAPVIQLAARCVIVRTESRMCPAAVQSQRSLLSQLLRLAYAQVTRSIADRSVDLAIHC